MPFTFSPRTLFNWLFVEPFPFWLGIGIPILATGLAYWGWPGSELAMRWAGFVITVAGVLLVIKGLRDKRIMFGRPAALSRLKEWLKRGKDAFVGRRVTHEARVAIDTMLVNDDVSELLLGGPDATTERRIHLIEDHLRRLDQRMASIRTEMGERITVEAERHRLAIEETKKHLATLKDRLEELSVGGLDFDTAGVLWVLAGSALATFPAELAAQMIRQFG